MRPFRDIDLGMALSSNKQQITKAEKYNVEIGGGILGQYN